MQQKLLYKQNVGSEKRDTAGREGGYDDDGDGYGWRTVQIGLVGHPVFR